MDGSRTAPPRASSPPRRTPPRRAASGHAGGGSARHVQVAAARCLFAAPLLDNARYPA
ncbi:Hypothetical protein FRAAL3671 [Frankia alni ACN14a]|uniref:Uncharacterized protein n=1 Tax=Frankia alni (strain DSM 45986 / CECT 9034 / ACN14a) TaxID=326424 RepID=Q0RJJ8_FRAAA|nr:Hypothetical protein FRAAL3671 [Frankia alni ACN14a]